MTFDVDILIEEILSKTINPDLIKSRNPNYVTLEESDIYLLQGGQGLAGFVDVNGYNGIQLLWIRYETFLSLIFRSESIKVVSEENTYTLISLQDWKKFLEQDLPEFVRKKSA